MLGSSHTKFTKSADTMHSITAANRLMKKRRFHRSVPGRMAAMENPTAVNASIAPIKLKPSRFSQSLIRLCTSRRPWMA